MAQAVLVKPPLLNEVLEMVEALPPEQQEMLVEIVHARLVERLRDQLVADAEEAMEAYRAGNVIRGTADELMAEIDRCVSS